MRPAGEEDRDYQATEATLAIGDLVALTLSASPERIYVGEVQVVDERGVRLSLVDSWDVFVAWEQIAWALVATPEAPAA
jgi:hypothetical protein